MKLFPPSHVQALADAIYESFPSVEEIEKLLIAPPVAQEFDALTSRVKSRKDNAWDIAHEAFKQGWAWALFDAARTTVPDSPSLRALAAELEKVGDVATTAVEARSDRPSLLCGRAAQWTAMEQCARARQHQVILVMGDEGQDSLHFRDRIQTYLADPRCSTVVVEWITRPVQQDEYFEALARAFECSPAQLAQTIAGRIAVQNVVLLHDLVDLRFDDHTLVQYYTEWLPALVAGHPNAPRLKSVQPIEWPPEAGAGGFLERLWGSGKGSTNGRAGAIALRDTLTKGEKDWMHIVTLKDLMNLTDDDLSGFMETSGLQRKQQANMLSRLTEFNHVPKKVFKAIDTYWNDVRSLTE